MKKLLIVALVIVLLAITGCSEGSNVSVSEEPLDINSGFALYGAKVEFDGVYPGWSGTVPVTIINGEDAQRSFRLSLITPSKLAPGWEALPEEYHDWITISQPSVTLSPGQTYEIPVTLTMPPDADYAGKKAEVQILVENLDQQGFVQIALAARWLIETSK